MECNLPPWLACKMRAPKTSALPFASLSLQTQTDSVLFHLQLFVLRNQRRAEKEYSKELVFPKGRRRCLNPMLIQRYRKDRASPPLRGGTLLKRVTYSLKLQKTPDLSQRKDPVLQYPISPVAMYCSKGACGSPNKIVFHR